jgi:alanyl-tRNA synthetase
VALDNGCNRWLEVWNLVFMQFDQDEAGTRTPLPRPGVDTGMGLERLASVQQREPINYRTDLFAPAMDRIQELLGDHEAEREAHQTAYRVIADHGRAATFLIADGVRPGSEGGEYVLRMIIRRALRFGRKIGFDEPFLAKIALVYIEQMGVHYPELRARRELILRTLTTEEEKFARTLDAALGRLEKVLGDLASHGEHTVSGDVVFDLHSTFGLPLEITRDVAQEHGYEVDEAGFVAAREAHAAASGSGAFKEYETGANIYNRLRDELVAAGELPQEGVTYDPYSGAEASSRIIALLRDGESVERAESGDRVEIVTAMTPFYVEAGGEVSDIGNLVVESTGALARVDEMARPVAGLIVHRGEVIQGSLAAGQEARMQVDDERRQEIRRHHTATHILHHELRRHLGPHVAQAGSLVAPDRLRFDFTHGEAVDEKTLAEIESAVNEAIFASQPVTITFMGQKEAIGRGAMALFGEKYGDIVRTIRIGDADEPYSFELCGGLHVENTRDIGLFRFTREEAVGAGVRRVEAVAGRAAQQYVGERLQLLDRIASRLNSSPDEVEDRIQALLAEQRSLQKEVERLQRRLARSQFEEMLGRMEQVDGANLLVAQVEVAGVDELREMADWFRDKVSSGVAVFGTIHNDKPMLIATVTEDLIARGVKAGDLVREAARIVGGGGGGRPNLAQAGGRDASRLPAALAAVPEMVAEALQ